MPVLDWLRLPEARNIVNLDDPSTTLLHRKIIRDKQFLTNLYLDFYAEFANRVPTTKTFVCVELGSGGGFLKEVIPELLTSDIIPLPGVDLCFSGEAMPFDNNSVDAIFMLDVFHHIKDPSALLREFQRALKPGGRVIMIEPANTIWARFVFKNFHHEGFDASGDWRLSGTGPLSDANIALPWIVFCRDRVRFQREHPGLKLLAYNCHTPIRYILSGGVSMRQLVPDWTFQLFSTLEWMLSPINRWIGMFVTIELQKVESKQ